MLHKGCREPEEQTAAHHTEGDHVDTVDAVGHGILAQRGHQSPEGAGHEHAKMGYEGAVLFHSFYLVVFVLQKYCFVVYF